MRILQTPVVPSEPYGWKRSRGRVTRRRSASICLKTGSGTATHSLGTETQGTQSWIAFAAIRPCYGGLGGVRLEGELDLLRFLPYQEGATGGNGENAIKINGVCGFSIDNTRLLSAAKGYRHWRHPFSRGVTTKIAADYHATRLNGNTLRSVPCNTSSKRSLRRAHACTRSALSSCRW